MTDFRLPEHVDDGIDGLPVYTDGWLCRLDPAKCFHFYRSEGSMRKHWGDSYQWTPAGGRYARKFTPGEQLLRKQKAMTRVNCQRLFLSPPHSPYFWVRKHSGHACPDPEPGPPGKSGDIAASIFANLDSLEEKNVEGEHILPASAAAGEISPWLEMTRWPKYLAGQDLKTVPELADLPHPMGEPLLTVMCHSLDRIVESAYRSVCEDRINAFDQIRINSFMQRPRAADRPLLVKLQKPTYRRYKRVWKQLICFVYRASRVDREMKLSHAFTAAQTVCFDRLVAFIRETCQPTDDFVQDQNGASIVADPLADLPAAQGRTLDGLCLDFCISLLDHDLRGDLFESAIVGFLAVLSVDKEKGVFREPCTYTSMLSGFIKIGQLLVVEKAVRAAEMGMVQHPSEVLDEMRDRFLAHGTRSPFNWANQLRMYGKRIRDSTTGIGYIVWSESDERLSYRDVSLTMSSFRALVRDQVRQAQEQLEDLLILQASEERTDLDLMIHMHRLVDRPVESRRGWCFVDHEGNRKGPLPDRKRWLLDRVIHNQSLLEEFVDCSTGALDKPLWRRKPALAYQRSVESFLERLLLLAHLTSGQPARGTELLSIRYKNIVHGQHRNLFVDHGMVSTVTSYHKGYSVTGSTKIIHRYLPKEVGELFVYHISVILPFCHALDLLALGKKGTPSAFLWPKGGGCWESNRLYTVLKREFGRSTGQEMNIPIYRHLAIAISRRHLPGGGFKRDYGLENTKFDTQSSHSSWTAGCIYARGMEEAPGHVEARKEIYRRISCEWHEFLGFTRAPPLPKKQFLENLGQG
jgi:hypothetical protein